MVCKWCVYIYTHILSNNIVWGRPSGANGQTWSNGQTFVASRGFQPGLITEGDLPVKISKSWLHGVKTKPALPWRQTRQVAIHAISASYFKTDLHLWVKIQHEIRSTLYQRAKFAFKTYSEWRSDLDCMGYKHPDAASAIPQIGPSRLVVARTL